MPAYNCNNKGNGREILLFISLFLSLLLPLLHAIYISENPTFKTPIIDSMEYIHSAKRILNSGLASAGLYYHSPLYTWFLASIFSFFVEDFVIIRAFQILLNVLNCFLIYRIGEYLFSRTTAVVAALIWSLYGPIIFYTIEILNVALILTLYMAAIYSLMWTEEKKRGAYWLAPGLIIGFAAITRPDILPFSLIVIGWVIFKKRGRGGFIPFFISGILIPITFVGIVNYKAGGGFLLLPANSGINFYIGNNEDYQKTIGIRPGLMWDRLIKMPLAEETDIDWNDPGQKRFYYKKAFQFIYEKPVVYLRCLLYKIRTLVNGYELPETLDLYTYREYSPILSLLIWQAGPFFFPYALLFPSSVCGFLSIRRTWEKYWVLWAFLIAVIPSLLIYWNGSRYRISIVPILILFAAEFMVRFKNLFSEKKVASILICIGGFLGLALLFNIPYKHFSRHYNYNAELYSLAAAELINKRRYDEALEYLVQFKELPSHLPDRLRIEDIAGEYEAALNAVSLNRIGFIMMQKGEYKEAKEYLDRAIEILPDFEVPYINKGLILEKEEMMNEAISYYSNAIKANKSSAAAHYRLANMLSKKGDDEDAIYHYREAIRLSRSYPEAKSELENLLHKKR